MCAFQVIQTKLLGKKSIHMASILIFVKWARNQYILLNTNF